MKRIFAAALLFLAVPAFAALSTTTNRVEYTGNASTKVFAFAFPVQASADVEVVVAGVKQTVGFAVSLNANQDASPGGSVTFTAAPAAALAVRVQRTPAFTQGTVLGAYSAFPAKTMEKTLDRMVQQTQAVDRRVGDAEATHTADVITQAAHDAAQDAANAQQIAAARGVNPYQATSDYSTVLAAGSTTARTLRDRAAEVANIMDFGAKCDGVTVDTAAIQAAVTASAHVLFPTAGSCKSGRITLPNRNTRIVGVAGAAILHAGAGDVFYQSHRGVLTEIEGLTFTGSGKAFYYDAQDSPLPWGAQMYEYRIRNCRFLQDSSDYAIYLYGAREGSIDNCYFETNKGIYRSKTVNTQVVGSHFKDCAGIVRDDVGSEGLVISGGVALGCATGLWTTGPVAGTQIVGVMWDYLDEPVKMLGAHDVVITGSYISGRSAAGPAISVGANGGARSSDIHIVGNAAILANIGAADAIVFDSADRFEVKNNGINAWTRYGVRYGNSTFGAINGNTMRPRPDIGAWGFGNTYSLGDTITYTGQTYTSLAYSNSGKFPDSQPTWWSSYANARAIYTSADDASISIRDNDMTLGINAATTRDISGNKGLITENSGEVTAASGLSSKTFAHGLSVAPLKPQIIVTPTSIVNVGGLPAPWFVSAVDATNITITFAGALSSNASFAWSARVRP